MLMGGIFAMRVPILSVGKFFVRVICSKQIPEVTSFDSVNFVHILSSLGIS